VARDGQVVDGEALFSQEVAGTGQWIRWVTEPPLPARDCVPVMKIFPAEPEKPVNRADFGPAVMDTVTQSTMVTCRGRPAR
jgi:hypothetical protein